MVFRFYRIVNKAWKYRMAWGPPVFKSLSHIYTVYPFPCQKAKELVICDRTVLYIDFIFISWAVHYTPLLGQGRKN